MKNEFRRKSISYFIFSVILKNFSAGFSAMDLLHVSFQEIELDHVALKALIDLFVSEWHLSQVRCLYLIKFLLHDFVFIKVFRKDYHVFDNVLRNFPVI